MNQLDPVNMAIALASVIFGPALAGVIGPYAVILIASTVGAAWSLGRRDQSARLGAAYLTYEDHEAEQGLSLLVSKGLLTAERKSAIVALMQQQ